jgi:hypothetical protein
MHKRRVLRLRQELFGEEERDGRNELKYVLHNAAPGARRTRALRRVVCAHDAVYAGLLRRRFFPRPTGTRRDRRRRPPAPIPDASQVVSGDDLAQPPGFDVAHFDEARVEDEDVWWVPGDVLRCAFPFDGTLCTTWVAVPVHIQPELCEGWSGYGWKEYPN